MNEGIRNTFFFQTEREREQERKEKTTIVNR